MAFIFIFYKKATAIYILYIWLIYSFRIYLITLK